MLAHLYASAHSKQRLDVVDFMPTLASRPKPKGINFSALLKHAKSHGQ